VVAATAIEPRVGGSSRTARAPHEHRDDPVPARRDCVRRTATIVVPRASLLALTSLATAPEGGGSEVPMQIRRSLSAKIRKWLGLGKRPTKAPYGAGAWGR